MNAKVLKFEPKKPKLPELIISIDPKGNEFILPNVRTDLERRQFLAAIMLFHADLLDKKNIPDTNSDEIEPTVLLISIAPTGVATMS